ncbi:MAG TPA: DEAD/DEAH box helicase [Polyangiaceae bacterium]|nr:DEAD/DEAH box helicase [Polyangiaceae bacterium]
MSAPSPVNDAPVTFDSLALSKDVRRAVDELGYKVPTPVQQSVFEPAKAGRDLVVQARTGTGKTAAFGLPLVDGLVKPKAPKVQAVVLCPTRELALQVSREVTALGAHTGVKVISVYGGAAMNPQIDALKAGAHIVVGTPGRVLDHIARGTLDVSGVRVLILDESDEMLSMGFLPQIDKIWSELPKNIQVLLFSATVPREVLRIAESRLKDPHFITLSGDQIGALEINHFCYISRGNKHDELLQMLEIENPESAIVFCNTRDETKVVASTLQAKGYGADWLNADLPQSERESVMRRTREGKLRFLVCTDVAARGIDISHLTHVINFDFPDSNEQYVHRTGRTGRAGRTGTALSLVAPSELGNLYFLRLQYKIRPVERQLPSALELRTRAETDVLVQLGQGLHDAPAEILALARRLLTHDNAERLVAGLLSEHLAKQEQPWLQAQSARRAKAPEPTVAVAPANTTAKPPEKRRGSVAKLEKSEPVAIRPAQRAPRREAARVEDEDLGIRYQVSEAPVHEPAESAPRLPRERAPRTTPADSKEIYVNVGKKDGAGASELRALLQEAGIDAADIKQISVRFRNSFIQVSTPALANAVAALSGKTFGTRVVVAEESRSSN